MQEVLRWLTEKMHSLRGWIHQQGSGNCQKSMEIEFTVATVGTIKVHNIPLR